MDYSIQQNTAEEKEAAREAGLSRCAPHSPPRVTRFFLCCPVLTPPRHVTRFFLRCPVLFLSSPSPPPPISICYFQLCNLSFSVSLFPQTSDFRSTIWNMSSWSVAHIFTEGLQNARACAGPWGSGVPGTRVASVPLCADPASREGSPLTRAGWLPEHHSGTHLLVTT